MRVAIMQPYFLPYQGYFNLLHASDMFVFLDDVQFIRRGWINRNRIQIGQEDFMFTVPVKKAPRDTAINRIRIAPEHFDTFVEKFLKQLRMAYGAAPYCAEVVALVEGTFAREHSSMALLAEQSVRDVCDYVGLRREMCRVSALEPTVSGAHLKGGARLVHVANCLGATSYLNPPGGRSLYAPELFAEQGIRLGFVEPDLPSRTPFAAALSILDALMYHSPDDILGMLACYSIQP